MSARRPTGMPRMRPQTLYLLYGLDSLDDVICTDEPGIAGPVVGPDSCIKK